MRHESLCIRVPRLAGERVRQLLMQLTLLDARRRILSDEQSIDIPLVREPSVDEFRALRGLALGVKIVEVEPKLLEKTIRPRNVVDALRHRVERSLLPYIKHSFDIIGEIAVIEVPPELSSLKELIAQAIVEVHKGVRTVLAKVGAVDGKFRVRNYEHLLGDPKTETTHKEHGCRYLLDVTKVYFSPRLATERLRIASQASTDEVVVDMFAGVGPFSVLIAKKKRVCVHAIDVNPVAVRYLKKNCESNKVEQLVKPILGDAREVISKYLRGVADRLIMNLPSESLEFVDAACSALKTGGGVIHSYQFQSAPNPIEKAVEALSIKIESAGRKLNGTLGGRLVRSVAPREWQVAVDAIIR